jgi:hypothetical protein
MDILWATSAPLSYVDPVWAMELHARNMLLSLRWGEPFRVSRALAGAAASSSSSGSRTTAHTWRVWRLARAIAERIDHPYALANTSIMGGWATFCEGRWAECVAHMDAAEATLRDRLTGVAWERNTAAFYRLRALEYLGRVREVAAGYPGALEDAEGRGDVYAATNLRLRIGHFVHLSAGDPDGAEAHLERGIGSWPKEPFRIQHFYEMQARCEIAHYRGDARAAWDFLEARRPALGRSHMLRIQTVRASIAMLRARTLLLLGERSRMEKEARSLEREGAAWCAPFAPLFRGERERAAAAFDACGMALYAACARDDLESVRRAGVAEPERWAAMYAPRS